MKEPLSSVEVGEHAGQPRIVISGELDMASDDPAVDRTWQIACLAKLMPWLRAHEDQLAG